MLLGNLYELQQTEPVFRVVSLGRRTALRQIISKYWTYGNRLLGYTTFMFLMNIVRRGVFSGILRKFGPIERF